MEIQSFGELFRHYIERYARHNTRTWRDMEDNYRRYFRIWDRRRTDSITRAAVQDWFDELAASKGKATANRSHDTMRAVFNWGIKRELVSPPNPCNGIDRHRLRARDRFVLPGEEFSRLAHAINAEPDETFKDFFWTCFLTGARKSNVLQMRWEDVSLDIRTWRIPDTKNGDPQFVPLTDAAIDLLIRRKAKATGPWVFPGYGPKGHLAAPKAAWRRVLTRAQISDLRIHDLRRTVGSWMAMNNQSLQIIGKALGHKSHAATQIYARLALDPVRAALEQAQAQMQLVASHLPGSESED